MNKLIVLIFCVGLNFSAYAVFHTPSEITNVKKSVVIKIEAQKELKKSKKTEAITSKTDKQKTTVADDEDYYLEDFALKPTAERAGKKTATRRTVRQLAKEEKATVPPIDRQKDQFAKLTQNRDNPKPTLLNYKNIVGVSGLFDADLQDQTKPQFMASRSREVFVSNAKLNLDVNLKNWVHGHVGYYYSDRSNRYYPKPAGENLNGAQLDEFYLSIKNFDKTPFYFIGGKQYLPFGSYHRFQIIEPLTQVLSETRDSAIHVGVVTKQGLYAAAYVFKGLSKYMKHDKHYNGGLTAGYSSLSSSLGYDIAVGYLNNMADVGAISHSLVGRYYYKKVGGLSVLADIMTGPFSFDVRYVAAVKRFDRRDFQYQSRPGVYRGAGPRATSIKAGYTFKTAGRPSKMNVGYQWTREAYNTSMQAMDPLHLPKHRLEVTYAFEPVQHIIFAFQYDRDRDYQKRYGGTNHFNNTITVRLTMLL